MKIVNYSKRIANWNGNYNFLNWRCKALQKYQVNIKMIIFSIHKYNMNNYNTIGNLIKLTKIL